MSVSETVELHLRNGVAHVGSDNGRHIAAGEVVGIPCPIALLVIESIGDMGEPSMPIFECALLIGTAGCALARRSA